MKTLLILFLLATIPSAKAALSAIWAQEGGDKVTRDELRAAKTPQSNTVFDGERIRLFSAKNETVNFNLILESAKTVTKSVRIEFDELTNTEDTTKKITSKNASKDLTDYSERPIENFYVRYLKIKGLSGMSYETYDERHVPKRMRRPFNPENGGRGKGTWSDRPDANKFYPDIAVPFELVKSFDIKSDENQSLWTDVYVPKETPSGVYSGKYKIYVAEKLVKEIPVELEVKNFTLPDEPTTKTMVYLEFNNIARRYSGQYWPHPDGQEFQITKRAIRKHYQLAHRHKISLIDKDDDGTTSLDGKPHDEWIPRLDGSLFTKANGYGGVGEGVGNGVYAIGAYGSWSWRNQGEQAMKENGDKWENWFEKNFPSTERFLYLIDESTNYKETETWASQAPAKLQTFATVDLLAAFNQIPNLDISATWFRVGDAEKYDAAYDAQKKNGKKVYMYNAKRPASGSFATEDDGVALRELAWGQFKKGIDRWFVWNSTYYNNDQGNTGATNVFVTAQTFGNNSGMNEVDGESGWNYSNGDGVLFYPGTDTLYKNDSYGINAPIASLRLKHWRRGIQDCDYLALAMKKNPEKTKEIIQRVIPKVLWELGVNDPNDPTWVLGDVSWSLDPSDWEKARAELAEIISTN